MIAPAALLDLELLPEEVMLEPISAPYKYLLVCKVPPSFQQHAAIVLHLTERPMCSSQDQAVWALARVHMHSRYDQVFGRRCHDCLGPAHSCVQSQHKAMSWNLCR